MTKYREPRTNRRLDANCKAMTNWPNTIQCLGSDGIMSLGTKSFAVEGVHSKVHDKVHDKVHKSSPSKGASSYRSKSFFVFKQDNIPNMCFFFEMVPNPETSVARVPIGLKSGTYFFKGPQ